MNLYEGIKEVAKVIQKADNIGLYQQLIDLENQAVTMQNDLAELQQENRSLKDRLTLRENVVRHKDNLYITLKNDPDNIKYCATCWGRENKLIQLTQSGKCFECERLWRIAQK